MAGLGISIRSRWKYSWYSRRCFQFKGGLVANRCPIQSRRTGGSQRSIPMPWRHQPGPVRLQTRPVLRSHRPLDPRVPNDSLSFLSVAAKKCYLPNVADQTSRALLSQRQRKCPIVRRAILALAVFLWGGCSSKFVDLQPVKKEESGRNELISAPERLTPDYVNRMAIVFDFYGQNYRTNGRGGLLIPTKLAKDKELLWNYSKKHSMILLSSKQKSSIENIPA